MDKEIFTILCKAFLLYENIGGNWGIFTYSMFALELIQFLKKYKKLMLFFQLKLSKTYDIRSTFWKFVGSLRPPDKSV